MNTPYLEKAIQYLHAYGSNAVHDTERAVEELKALRKVASEAEQAHRYLCSDEPLPVLVAELDGMREEAQRAQPTEHQP